MLRLRDLDGVAVEREHAERVGDAGLAILDAVEAGILRAAERLIQEDRISVGYDEHAPDVLYVKAEVFFGHEQVIA